MDSHLDGRTGPQSYIEALPPIQGNENKDLAPFSGGVGRADARRKLAVALPLLYLKAGVGSTSDHENQKFKTYSCHVLVLG